MEVVYAIIIHGMINEKGIAGIRHLSSGHIPYSTTTLSELKGEKAYTLYCMPVLPPSVQYVLAYYVSKM
jgi:hypothetical protein